MSDQIALLVTEVEPPRFVERLRRCSGAEAFRIIVPEKEGEEALCARAPEADAFLCYKAPLPGSAIHAATRLKLIQKHGRNCRNIDVAAAFEKGIPVATRSLLRNASVAEHALALMLACARKVLPGHKAVSEAAYLELGLEPITTNQWDTRGNWANIEGLSELFEKTVGIIGMGDIGIEIARRCKVFEMEVVYNQRTPHSEAMEKSLGIQFLPLDKLLSVSDYVVLVIPHTPETEGLIGRNQLTQVKPNATLINVGRGGLIDEEALIESLREGGIAMAGLDVYRQEPLPESSPLRDLPNVVLLPHTGGGSSYWNVDMPATLEAIHKFFQGEQPQGVINAIVK